MTDELAPVTPLFGASPAGRQRPSATDGPQASVPGESAESTNTPDGASREVRTRLGDVESGGPRLVSIPGGQGETQAFTAVVPAGMEAESRERLVEEAQEMLVRALARSDRSTEEARRLLRDWRGEDPRGAQPPEDGTDEAAEYEQSLRLEEHEVEHIVDRCTELGYLDDFRLAELLVHKARDKKRSGIQGVERALRERHIAAEAMREVLDEVDRDDELERARELATERARRVKGVEPDAAIRRIAGFLSRRGYSSGVAFTAAREAVQGSSRPSRPPGGSAGVFFGASPVE
ncbi:regulatory protein RecX [Pseudoclavibacter helvolus]|uniref:regulatory protein RecX n=1 Tax=Pseudoclavibacter helvolus TaxID=255205 RepID=UPI003C7958A6